jgi:hypothetical protein
MSSDIQQLSDIISSSVSELLEVSKVNGFYLPVLHEPFQPAKNAFRSNTQAAEATAKIIAAAIQLATTLMTPEQGVNNFIAGV